MRNYRAVVTLYDERDDDVVSELTIYDNDPRMAVERAAHGVQHTITRDMEPPETAELTTTGHGPVGAAEPTMGYYEDLPRNRPGAPRFGATPDPIQGGAGF